MEPLCVDKIDNIVEEQQKWDTNELLFEIENDKFDLIPYLGEGFQSTETLSFAIPVQMDQKELIVVLKQQSAAQGIHLTTVKSSSNHDSAHGCHFTLGCY